MRLAHQPEDFVVDEVPLYEPSGEGAHTFVRVEKRMRTTEEVARMLARVAGVPPRDVGNAGRKGRVAVTRQWLSVPGLDPAHACELAEEGVRVLEARRHPHKLRTGQLRANRFALVVRELAPAALEGAEERLAVLVRGGMPNRFGAQRFGRGGRNADAGRALLEGRPVGRDRRAARPVGRDRRAARFLLSALQAEVWNACLDARPLPLDAVEEGEVAFVHASGASFVVEDAAREGPRAASFEISAAGPLFGTRLLEALGEPGAREEAVLRTHGVAPGWRPPPGIRLRGARRPYRVRPEQATCEPAGSDAMRLRFTLPPGSYASELARALFAGPSGRP
ncbi:MAG: tRNA pseudouridine(13) synthase TruD [Myxococcota bacterium]